MPVASPVALRKQLAAGKADPVYLIVGDDEAEMSQLANAIAALVEVELRAFNLERLYASDKSVSPFAIVQAARTLPMLGDRRVVLVLRAERILKPKRRGKAAEPDEETAADIGAGDVEAEPSSSLEAIEDYVKSPEPNNTLVFVASDVDRQRKVYKALQKHATIVECWGLKGEKDPRFLDLRQVARQAEALVRQAVTAAGQEIEPAAARLVAERAGAEISTLRGDVERLLLYAAGKPKITLQDAKEVVTGESSHDAWAVTNAISRCDTREALRQLGLALESGGISYQILGQLAYFVREKLSASDPRRMASAVEALFRTDLDLKSSGGDPRVLLERLVVELCRRGREAEA